MWKPPYTHLNAVDLNTGEALWRIPIGDGPRDHELLKDLNLPKLGDRGRAFPLVTKTLVLIAHSANKPKLYAFDKATGKEIAAIPLERKPQGAPMTYLSGGKQYVAIPVGGRREAAGLLALALP